MYLAEGIIESFIINFDAQMVASILLHAISILILFFILSKLLINPVREALKKRKDGIAKEYNFIKDEKQKATELEKEYKAKLANINKEADMILEEARKKAQLKEREIIKNADDEAARLMARANKEIEREKDKVKDEIKGEMIEVAKILASKFVASSIDKKASDKLLQETLDSIGEETWLN
ncbi:hypothetical protein SH1V18_30840 [Vallitalea longa]|uniref:ATP synthase subunit b n=1 Tax=Vallitalea longa TaxID=2936439 RepID=A0A9W6DH87_9FIRM|nr:F0F1 ATP synthase subunit B [Vallitalea longa]GKX30604.1 hypothetical protein SH1V18_30840 [Vallitalea longa]